MVSKFWLLFAPLVFATTSLAAAINLSQGLQRLATTANATSSTVFGSTIHGVNVGAWYVRTLDSRGKTEMLMIAIFLT